MGATVTLVPDSEYLHTVYEPECDYVDGVLVDRNEGGKTNAKAQKRLLRYLENRHEAWVYTNDGGHEAGEELRTAELPLLIKLLAGGVMGEALSNHESPDRVLGLRRDWR